MPTRRDGRFSRPVGGRGDPARSRFSVRVLTKWRGREREDHLAEANGAAQSGRLGRYWCCWSGEATSCSQVFPQNGGKLGQPPAEVMAAAAAAARAPDTCSLLERGAGAKLAAQMANVYNGIESCPYKGVC